MTTVHASTPQYAPLLRQYAPFTGEAPSAPSSTPVQSALIGGRTVLDWDGKADSRENFS